MTERVRVTTVSLRVNDDEQRMVKELADADGISISDVVRMLVRRAHQERFGVKKPKVKKK
jgi:antitoxin component of RelBE/YafQ-DinJ toxin-antitoxin module